MKEKSRQQAASSEQRTECGTADAAREKGLSSFAFQVLGVFYCLLPPASCFVLAGWVALASGCGYSFSGIGEGFPEGVRTVFIERFVNRSRDVTIDWEITTALRSEFHRQRLLQVVDSIDEADAILSGVVRSVETRVVAVNRNDEALQLETALVVDMSLRRRSPDEVLWRTESAKLTETHAASRGAVVTTSSEFKRGTLNPGDLREFTDIQLTETLSGETRERLVEGFAHDLHQRVVEMF